MRRAVVTTVAVLLTAGFAATLAGTDAELGAVAAGLGGFAVVTAMVGAGAGWPSTGPIVSLALGAGFAVTRVGEPRVVDSRAVPAAIVLFVIAELVAWAAEEREARPPGVVPLARLQRLALNTAIGGVATLLVGAAAVAPAVDDLGLAAIGVAGIAVVAAVVSGVLRGRSTPT